MPNSKWIVGTVALFVWVLAGCEKKATQSAAVSNQAIQDQSTLVKSLVQKLQDPSSDLYSKGAQYQDTLESLHNAHPEIKEKVRETYLSLLQSIQSMTGADAVGSAVRGARGARGARRSMVGGAANPAACVPPAPPPAGGGVCPSAFFCAWAVGFASAQAYAYAYAFACKDCASGETICVEAEAHAYAYAYAYAFAFACAWAGGGAPVGGNAPANPAAGNCNGNGGIMDALIADVVTPGTAPNLTASPPPTAMGIR